MGLDANSRCGGDTPTASSAARRSTSVVEGRRRSSQRHRLTRYDHPHAWNSAAAFCRLYPAASRSQTARFRPEGALLIPGPHSSHWPSLTGSTAQRRRSTTCRSTSVGAPEAADCHRGVQPGGQPSACRYWRHSAVVSSRVSSSSAIATSSSTSVTHIRTTPSTPADISRSPSGL